MLLAAYGSDEEERFTETLARGMKLFEDAAEMEAIPKIRRPKAKHTTDQIVAQARQLGWTVGITMADLVGAQCGAVIGLHPQDDEWLSGKRRAGVWFKTQEAASLHQHAMDCVPFGRYSAMAVAPLASNRLNPPDICLLYGTPGQMIFNEPLFIVQTPTKVTLLYQRDHAVRHVYMNVPHSKKTPLELFVSALVTQSPGSAASVSREVPSLATLLKEIMSYPGSSLPPEDTATKTGRSRSVPTFPSVVTLNVRRTRTM